MKIEFNDKPEIICEVFEDNQSAYLLATNQQLSVRTKYFCVKYHFFWQFVYHEEKNPEGWLHVGKCSTDLMNADYMTKGLVRIKFEANRKKNKDFTLGRTSPKPRFISLQGLLEKT